MSEEPTTLQEGKKHGRSLLWFISEIYYPDETSTGFVVTRLAEAAAANRPVKALCGLPRYDRRGSSVARSETRNGVAIRRCHGTTFSKNSLFGRLLNTVTITLSIAARATWEIRANDTVVVTTNPPVLPFLIALIARARGARTLLMIHDVFPEALIAAGMIRRTSLSARILAGLGARLYQRVDAIAVCGRDMADIVSARAADPQPLLGLVRNWADTELIAPTGRRDNPLLRELGLGDRFVVQYAGNMGPVHDIPMIVDAAAALQQTHPEIHFLFIGSGSRLPRLRAEISRRELKNITILGPQPRDAQASFLNACDIAITAFVPGMYGAGVPSRMYNVMAAGKPWIAAVDSTSEIGLVIQEENAGWVVAPRDTPNLIAAIVAAFERPDRLEAMGSRARHAVEDKYTFAVTCRSLENLLGEIEAER